jgi:hypothetical protein
MLGAPTFSDADWSSNEAWFRNLEPRGLGEPRYIREAPVALKGGGPEQKSQISTYGSAKAPLKPGRDSV